jgi:hypothetical protein
MWSKRPKPGGKGLRCQVTVRRDGQLVPCDRPAKRYRKIVQPVAAWVKNLVPYESDLNCCIGHLRKLLSEDVDLERVDLRKGTAKVASIPKRRT